MRTAGQGPGGFEKRDGHINPGQELIFAGSAGLAGARRILEAKKEILSRRFAPSFLRELKEEEYSVKSWLDQATAEKNSPVTAWEFAGEGGVLAALWNFSGIYCTGLDVDLRLFPVHQAAIEVCELFELNPYRLYSENCVLLAADSGSRLVRELKQAGIPAAVIGWAEKGIARKLRHGEETAGYLERPQPDELLKLGL